MGLSPATTTAIVVTRGDVDIEEILDSFREAGFTDVLVWANDGPVGPVLLRICDGSFEIKEGEPVIASVEDLKVFGRFAAMRYARFPTVYVQDDDCIVEIEALFEAANDIIDRDPAAGIIANMPLSRWDDYPDSCLIGWGSIFPRGLAELAFEIWSEEYALCTPGLYRDCDVVFTTLSPHSKVDTGFRHLPWAETPGRMFRQPGHKPSRDATLTAARVLRDRRSLHE